MTILFGTARTKFPDFADPQGGVQQLLDRSTEAIAGFLDVAGGRIFNNSFVEDGTQHVSGSSFLDSKFSDLVEPSRRQTKTQFPQATVFLKKKMFSTLRSNYDVRFMDDQERIFLRAIKNLFRRKAEEIAFYENLVVLEKVIEDPEFLRTDNALDLLLSAFFTVSGLGFGVFDPAELGQQLLGGVIKPDPSVLMRLRRLQGRAKQNVFTTWIVDPNAPNFSGTGPGVGVIEFTWMTNISTRTSLETGGGNCSLTIEDPYRLTRITETDIDLALKQALSEDQGPVALFDTTAQRQLEEAQELDRELNELRRQRGVSEINFEFSTETGDPFFTVVQLNQAYTISRINEIPSEQALAANEVTRVISIINNLRSYESIKDRSVNSLQNSNRNFAPIREKMRREFVGHHIFQQMDAIHVFANSFTRDETPIYANRTDLLLNNSFGDITTSEEQRGKLSDLALEAERQVIAPEMSLLEYKAFRNPTEWRGTGPQIFSGLVTQVDSSYTANNGKFMLRVSAKDNIEFLNLSRINVQPGLTQPQGTLEDPLTPFDFVVDEDTGLVKGRKLSDTNKKRLPFLRFDDGTFLGDTVDEEDRLIQDTGADLNDVLAYQHVPGLVYKWKQGIIVATQDVNTIRPISRGRSTLGDIHEDYGVTISTDPFANLDAADIISILVTGQPYNYNNFIQNALDAGNYTIDTDTNTRSYFNYLFDFLERQNQILGNFVPAKISNIDPEVVSDAFRIQRQLTQVNTRISELQRQRASLADRINTLASEEGLSEASQVIINGLEAEKQALDSQIAEANQDLDASSLSLGERAQFQLFGNAVQVHFNEVDHQLLKNRLKYIVRKKPEEVRFNQDKNYFLVSEKYDADTDIQAFVLNLKNQAFELWDSEFKKPGEICAQVAGVIDFEFFADTQGNIQFRNPQYNKTPLSLLVKMVELGRTDGVSLIPDFLIKLLSSRSQSILRRLLRLELEIYEGLLLLSSSSANFTANAATEAQNKYGMTLALAEQPGADTFELSLKVLNDSLSNDKIFTEAAQSEVIFSPPLNTEQREERETIDPVDYIIRIRNQLADLRGSTTAKLDPDKSEDRNQIRQELRRYEANAEGVFINRLNLANRIGQLVTQRQSLARVAARLSEEEDQLNSINDNAPTYNPFSSFVDAAGAGISGNASDIPNIPRALEGLIEDDLHNLEGFNSAKRFIIDDDVIRAADFSIKTPQYSRVDVNGDENLIGGQLKQANGLIFWAGATDFDSWRQYGYRAEQPFNRAYLQDPETQCAPYAVFKLLQQRKMIHSGTITVIGNEFYQAGDVVYVKNRQMLYYVQSVSHNISLSGGTFTTTLELTYGHALGEYIPTPLDIIGKAMLSDTRQHHGWVKANRSLVPSVDVVHLETMSFPITAETGSLAAEFEFRAGDDNGDLEAREDRIRQQFARENLSKATRAIQRAALRINDNNQDIARLEVRGYYLSGTIGQARVKRFISFAADLLRFASAETTLKLSDEFSDLPITNNSLGFLSSATPGDLFAPTTLLEEIDPIDLSASLTPEQARLRRMPSSQAWANSADVQFGVASGLPINSVDIFLVIDKDRRGDRDVQTPRPSQTSPNNACRAEEVASTVSDFSSPTNLAGGQGTAISP